MSRRRRWLAAAALGALTAAALLTVRFGSAALLSLALAAPASEPWLRPLGQDVARQEIRLAARGRLLEADLYGPSRRRAALLLVHGLSPSGRRHPDLVRLANLLAQRGQLVLVPHFEGLAAFRLSGDEVAEIRAALEYLRGLHGAVGVAGFSFGAGPALLAAADLPGLRLAASFGGYADLRDVIAYVTTGVYRLDDRRYAARQEEYNRWKLLALLSGFLGDRRDQERIERLARIRLANPAEETPALEASRGPEGRAVLALVLNRNEAAVDPLIASLPAGAREAMAHLSPLAAVPRLSGKLLIAHGADDPSIPFTESLRLAGAAGGRARVVILEGFHHTGPRPVWQSLGRRALDGGRLLLLVDELLAGR
ncbi:MAG TPA: hypothetical protein VFN71_14500 [Methylomirabilota bacterium]|nr:hypothetical protein [Methylomirabilota bacterium]